MTPKQQRFVAEYLIDLNATQAAIRAGYSAKTAQAIGSENLRKPLVAEAIEEGKRQQLESAGLSAAKVLAEYRKLAFSDMRRLMTWGPDGMRLKDSDDLSDDEAACVSEVSQTISKDGGSLKLKVHDKKGALDSIARHFGMFIDKQEVSGPNGASLIPILNVSVSNK